MPTVSADIPSNIKVQPVAAGARPVEAQASAILGQAKATALIPVKVQGNVYVPCGNLDDVVKVLPCQTDQDRVFFVDVPVSLWAGAEGVLLLVVYADPGRPDGHFVLRFPFDLRKFDLLAEPGFQGALPIPEQVGSDLRQAIQRVLAKPKDKVKPGVLAPPKAGGNA